MTSGHKRGSSYLVRVIEQRASGEIHLKVQNLKTGEMRSFVGWEAFMDYVRTQPRAGTLK